MAITVMCDANDTGAFISEEWTKHVRSYRPEASPIYLRTFAEGCVVAEREANGYDDSDFYATFWDGEKFVEFMYRTTRGWCYPNTASIDATQEIAAKYQAHIEAAYAAASARRAAIDAKRPAKGKRCVITAKRGKAAKFNGQEGSIFWTQEQRSQYGTWSYGTRVGVDINGERVFVNDSGIIVVVCDQEQRA